MASKAEPEDVWGGWERKCKTLTSEFAEVPVSNKKDRAWYTLWYKRVEWMVGNFVGEFRALRGAVSLYPKMQTLDFEPYFEYKEIAYEYILDEINKSGKKQVCRERFDSPACKSTAEEVLQKMQSAKPFISKEELNKVLESRVLESTSSTSSPEIDAIKHLLQKFELKGLNLMNYLNGLIKEEDVKAELEKLEEIMAVKYRF